MSNIKQGEIIKQPEQLKLFSEEDFIRQVLDSENNPFNNNKKYFQERTFPPNNASIYYFGIKFTDEQHRELITRINSLQDVLRFYSRVWRNGNPVNLDEISDNEQKQRIAELLGVDDNDLKYSGGEILNDIIKKIVDGIRNNKKLQKIIEAYDNINNDLEENNRGKYQRDEEMTPRAGEVTVIRTAEEILEEGKKLVGDYVDSLNKNVIEGLKTDIVDDNNRGGGGIEIAKIVRELSKNQELNNKFPQNMSSEEKFQLVNDWLREIISKREF